MGLRTKVYDKGQLPRLADSDTGLPWWIACLVSIGICALVIVTSHVVHDLLTNPTVYYLPYPGN